LLHDLPQKEYRKNLESVPGLKDLILKHHKNADENLRYFLMEFALHGLSEFSMLSRKNLVSGTQFKDLLSSLLNVKQGEEEDEENLQ